MPLEICSLLCRLLTWIEREAQRAGVDIEIEVTKAIDKLSKRK